MEPCRSLPSIITEYFPGKSAPHAAAGGDFHKSMIPGYSQGIKVLIPGLIICVSNHGSFVCRITLVIFNLEFGKIRFVSPFTLQFIIVNGLSQFIHKGISNTVIIISIIVKYTIAVHINSCTEHEFNLIFKIGHIRYISHEPVSPSYFIKDPHIGGQMTIITAEVELHITIIIFGSIIPGIAGL
jgi:hypothetical protein